MHSLYDNEMKLEFLSKSNNEAFASELSSLNAENINFLLGKIKKTIL